MFNFFKKRRSSGGQMKRRKTTNSRSTSSRTKTSTLTNKNSTTRKVASAGGRTASYSSPKVLQHTDGARTGKGSKLGRKKVVKTKGGNYPVYKKRSVTAKSFRTAFADAKKSGYKTFTWNGKKYNTKTK